MNFAQFIGYLFFGPETLYNRDIQTSTPRTQNWSLFSFHRIMPKPLSREDFLLPIYLLGDYHVLVPIIAYAITFNFTLVLMTVEIPAFFTGLFHLTPQQIGINFLGLLVGCVLKTRSFYLFFVFVLTRRADALWVSWLEALSATFGNSNGPSVPSTVGLLLNEGYGCCTQGLRWLLRASSYFA
jgi:hypothetical protein